MATRIASAAIGLPLLLLVVWIDHPWPFAALVSAAAAIGALELCGMARRRGDRPLAPLAACIALALVVAAQYLAGSSLAPTIPQSIALACAALSFAWMLGRGRREIASSRWIATTAVALLMGGLLFHAPLLRSLEQGREWILLLLLVTFATDTAAFFVGRTLGRTPLAPTISPSKTREGAAGGVIGAVAASVAVVYVFNLDAELWKAIVMGMSIGVAGQLGDLTESKLKRIAGVKDSGWVLPGHGGILDRLDSIVLNLVVVYYFVL